MHLAAAGLGGRERDIDTEPRKDRHGRLADAGEQRVVKTGDEQCDAHSHPTLIPGRSGGGLVPGGLDQGGLIPGGLIRGGDLVPGSSYRRAGAPPRPSSVASTAGRSVRRQPTRPLTDFG